MSPGRVALDGPLHPVAAAMLAAAGWTVLDWPPGGPVPPCEALIVRIRPMAPEDLAGLRMVSKHGVGVDNLPLAAARERGVAVTNTPGCNAAAVVEQALMLLLALLRDLDGQRAGRRSGIAGAEGARLAVVGYGAQGRRMAAVCRSLGMAVTVVVRPGSPAGVAAADAGFPVAPLGEALDGARALSLHVPLTPATRGLIGAAELARMAPGAAVVNCARGGLVDEEALVAALEAGQVGGAGLDATVTEPLPAGHPLRRLPGVILTPHAGGAGRDTFRRTGEEAARNVIDWSLGRLRPEVVVVP